MSALAARCPRCGRANNMHDGPDPAAAPAPGDVSICWDCAAIGIFTEDGVRSPTPEELAEIRADPEVKAAQAAMRESYTPSQAAGLLRGGR